MSAGDFSAFADFGAPLVIERPFEQQAPIPAEAGDSFDRILNTMEDVFKQTGDQRLALAYGLQKARDETIANMRGPGGRYRKPSRKAVRRVVAAWDHLIASGQR